MNTTICTDYNGVDGGLSDCKCRAECGKCCNYALWAKCVGDYGEAGVIPNEKCEECQHRFTCFTNEYFLPEETYQIWLKIEGQRRD